jgi:ABC-2 type transport system permease protein
VRGGPAPPTAAAAASAGGSPYAWRPGADPVSAAGWSRRRLAVTNLRAVFGRALPRIVGAVREPSWVAFEIGMPLLTTTAFVLVYRAIGAPEEFVGFAVVGGAMIAFWMNVVWGMAAQLYWERSQGNLELYFTAPIHLMSILLGMAIGGLFMSSIRAVVVITAASLLFGVRYAIDDWAALLLAFVLTLAALYGLGMLLASLFLLWGREAWHLVQLLQEPVYFLGGLYTPIRVLGSLAFLVAGILPLAVGLDAIRQLAFAGTEGIGLLPVQVEIAILSVMVVVFVLLAHRALAFVERLARREGRLTIRWQ